jgi:hypothetical protein
MLLGKKHVHQELGIHSLWVTSLWLGFLRGISVPSLVLVVCGVVFWLGHDCTGNSWFAWELTWACFLYYCSFDKYCSLVSEVDKDDCFASKCSLRRIFVLLNIFIEASLHKFCNCFTHVACVIF